MNKNFFVLYRLIQKLIKKGKKSLAVRFVFRTVKQIRAHYSFKKNAYRIIRRAVYYVRPLLNLRKVKRSSKFYYLPRTIDQVKRINLALH
jgi:ribosomal protein S7